MPVATEVHQQRASFASTFAEANPFGLKGVNQRSTDYIAKLQANDQKRQLIGEQPVTLVNLNSYELMVLGPLFDGLKVAPNQSGQHYSALVIRDVRNQVNTETNSPEEFSPIELATEFVNRYREKGGVFLLRGNLQQNPELEHTTEFRNKFAAAHKQMLAEAWSLKRQGDKEWYTDNHAGRKNIGDSHRTAARVLFANKQIPAMPEWSDLSPEDFNLPRCPSCGADIAKGRALCGCGRIYDPALAFKNGDIDEMHAALERLTRAQVEELGVSLYVAETVDERPVRLSSGKPKPTSLFERNQRAARVKEVAATKVK